MSDRLSLIFHDLALRGGGLVSSLLSVGAICLLARMLHGSPAHAVRPVEFLLGGIGFLTSSMGAMLMALGHHILDPVIISER